MTIVPVPYKEINATSSVPSGYIAATGSSVALSGTPSSSKSSPYSTSTPLPFTGAASRAGVGMSLVVVLVAGLFAL